MRDRVQNFFLFIFEVSFGFGFDDFEQIHVVFSGVRVGWNFLTTRALITTQCDTRLKRDHIHQFEKRSGFRFRCFGLILRFLLREFFFFMSGLCFPIRINV